MNWKSAERMNTDFQQKRIITIPVVSETPAVKFIKKGDVKAYLNTKPWFIRLTNKEYWSAIIFFTPLVFYIIYLAIKARSLFFFSAANPAIPTGGLIGESKEDINNLVPPQYRPKTVVLHQGNKLKDIISKMENAQLQFPVIIKPIVGCRGMLVKKISKYEEVFQHLQQYNTSFLIEEFIDYPIEGAILYLKNPETGESEIQSVTLKEFLTVKGNGIKTIAELLMENPRGVLQLDRLNKENTKLMSYIPKIDEKVLVEPIGNHCKGTKFLNYNYLINQNMVAAYDKIQEELPGCYIYRLDLRAASIADLQNACNIKILEINGVGSDPAHIYDAKTPLFEMFYAYIRMWKKVYVISKVLNRMGVPYMTYKEYRKHSDQQAAVEKLLV